MGHEAFPGAAYEGKTFLPMMEAMRRRHGGLDAVCVADAGMFGEANLAGLESEGHQYIVGARLRSLAKTLKLLVKLLPSRLKFNQPLVIDAALS